MTNPKKKIGKSMYLWMRSFLIIFLLTDALIVVLTTWMVNSFSREITKLNHSLTSIVQKSVDIRLNAIDNFTAQLELNPTNLSLSKSSSLAAGSTKALWQFSNQLGDYKRSNAFIRNIYIYYPELDYVVGDLGYFPSLEYYLLSNNLQYEGYEQWVELLSAHRKKGYFFDEAANGETGLFYTRALPYNDQEKKTAVMMLHINQDEVLNILKNNGSSNAGSLTAVITPDNRIYTRFGDTPETEILDKALSSHEESFFTIGNYFGSIQNSEKYPMRFITLMNRREILETSYFIRNCAYATIFLCMILGMSLFAFMGKRNNKPLKRILDKLQTASSPLTEAGEGRGYLMDDYSFIDNGIDCMMQNNRKNQEELREQRIAMEGLFLYHLLDNEERNNSVIFASMQRFNLQLEYSLFQIMIIRNRTGFHQQESKSAVKTIVNSIKERREELYVIATEFHEDIVLLFHMDSDYDRERMRLLAEELLDRMKPLPATSVLYGGEIFDSMSNIITSYQQALLLAESGGTPEERILFYDLGTWERRTEDSPGPEVLCEYESAMLEGNFDQADRLVDDLFSRYVGCDGNVFTARAKKYAVLNPLLEAMGRVSFASEEKKEALIRQLSEAKDQPSLLRGIHEILGRMSGYYRQKQEEDRQGAAERAKKYIELNFTNPMIGLYSISDLLGMSNTYLSTIFKKKYGTGIAQYINKLRIERAKSLILNTDYNVKEIALSVGFSSDVTFIRVFKQFENTTPGKFKNHNQLENQD